MYLGIIRAKKIEGMAKDGNRWRIRLYGEGKDIAVGRVRGNLLFSKMLQSDVRRIERKMKAAAKDGGDCMGILETRASFREKYIPLRGEIAREVFNAELLPDIISIYKGAVIGFVVGAACFMYENSAHIAAVKFNIGRIWDFPVFFDRKEIARMFEGVALCSEIAGSLITLGVDWVSAWLFRRKALGVFDKAGMPLEESG